ncbi:hypothetical protein K7711_24925 [Nocardia sp. CA2R105]|uniref:hypothetical protein n=1 Tax=Nocardia coffeae TaxID=2873381 RepID=UPI001CA6EF79|nr:hypothetical protein [Nocardia coffeae]MBY8859734.1 hypothetical protein [Nocardia coffeae]
MTGRHAYIVPVIVPTGDGGRVAARGDDAEPTLVRSGAGSLCGFAPEAANRADEASRRPL